MQSIPNSLKIGVIRGGPSSEYETSLKSGANILEALSESHRPIDIFISKEGDWHMQGLEKSPAQILKNVDVVLNAVHGQYGEDGKLQELLEAHGVRFTGSKKYESALTMNKWLTKEHLKQIGIKTPTYVLVRQTDDLKQKAKDIFSTVPHPLIVKPVKGSAGAGIIVVDNYLDLYNALYNILSERSDAIVEEQIVGKQATVGVIDDFRGQKFYTLPPVEVKKSKDGSYEYFSPGNFSQKEKKEIELLSSLVHEHLGLRHFSESDFIVTPKRGIYFLEVNTSPALTKESHFPSALNSVGSSLKEFINHVLLLSLNKK